MSKPARIVQAPAPDPALMHPHTVFLAGTTTTTATSEDWRDTLCAALSERPVTFYNPLRRDWDASWRNDAACGPFREQTEWELDRQTRADLVVVYLGPHTDAPVSLLELGLVAGLSVQGGTAVAAAAAADDDDDGGTGDGGDQRGSEATTKPKEKKKKKKQILVCAHEGYKKRGNVQILCQRFGIEMVDTAQDFPSAILRMLDL